jgi:hypothetical protein
MLVDGELLRFYPKIEVTRLLRCYLREATDDFNEEFSVVLFGNLADSTAEMTQTVLKDAFRDTESLRRVSTIQEALKRPGKIVFIDDNIGWNDMWGAALNSQRASAGLAPVTPPGPGQ